MSGRPSINSILSRCVCNRAEVEKCERALCLRCGRVLESPGSLSFIEWGPYPGSATCPICQKMGVLPESREYPLDEKGISKVMNLAGPHSGDLDHYFSLCRELVAHRITLACREMLSGGGYTAERYEKSLEGARFNWEAFHDRDALLALSLAVSQDRVVGVDTAELEDLLWELVDHSDIEADCYLGDLLLHEGTQTAYDEAYGCYLEGVLVYNRLNDYARFRMGQMIDAGLATEKDPEMAMRTLGSLLVSNRISSLIDRRFYALLVGQLATHYSEGGTDADPYSAVYYGTLGKGLLLEAWDGYDSEVKSAMDRCEECIDWGMKTPGVLQRDGRPFLGLNGSHPSDTIQCLMTISECYLEDMRWERGRCFMDIDLGGSMVAIPERGICDRFDSIVISAPEDALHVINPFNHLVRGNMEDFISPINTGVACGFSLRDYDGASSPMTVIIVDCSDLRIEDYQLFDKIPIESAASRAQREYREAIRGCNSDFKAMGLKPYQPLDIFDC